MDSTIPAPVRTNPNGRASAANSTPVVLSTEDAASLSAGIDAENGKTFVGNMREKFRESFNSKDAANWDFSEDASDKVFIDGNAASESYAVFSKSALAAGKKSTWLSKGIFKLPYKALFGMSLSQRVMGEEHAIELVGVDANGNVIEIAAPSPVAISGTVTVASNVATVNFAAEHGIPQGATVVLYGNTYSPLNVGPVVATVVTRLQITVPCTAANGTYTAGGFVLPKCPCGNAQNAILTRWQGTTAGNADAVSSNGATPRVVAWNPGGTLDTAALPNEGGIDYASKAFTRAFRSRGTWHMEHATDSLSWLAFDTDAIGAARSQSQRDNAIPTGNFKVRLRSESFANKSIPVGQILSISKSGSTTATVTMDRNHGLTAGSSFIQIYGVRDQTNFANLTTLTAAATVVNATQFTIAFGASATASSYGGYVMLGHGNNAPSQSAVVAQTYAKTSDGLRMSVVGNTNWSLTIGATYTAYGFVNASNAVIAGIEGRWRVAYLSGTTVEFEPLDGQTVSSLPSSATNCGGGFILNTDFRINRLAILDRFAVKVDSATAANVGQKAMPVYLNGGSVTATGIAGAAAHDAAISGNPVRTAGRALTANYTTVATGDTADFITTLSGVQVTRDYSIPELEYGIADTITNSATAVQVRAALASNHAYVTGLSLQTATLSGATVFQLRSTPIASTTATIASNTLVMAGTYNWKVGDLVYVTVSTVTGLTAGNYYYLLTVSGASLTFSATRGGSTAAISGSSVVATLTKVMYRTTLQTTALPLINIPFQNPLSGGTGLAIEAVTLTAVTGGIDLNVQGYVAP